MIPKEITSGVTKSGIGKKSSVLVESVRQEGDVDDDTAGNHGRLGRMFVFVVCVGMSTFLLDNWRGCP